MKEKYGVCIIQKCLSEGDESAKITIINLIIESLEYIIIDKFGNYLIQYIFTNCYDINFNLILPLIEKIEEKIIEYCKCKYSASVLEKCFEKRNEKINQHFLNYLLNNCANDIINIAANQFGFFVIKKSLITNNVETGKRILKIIEKDIRKLKNGSKEKNMVYSLLKQFSNYLK